MDSQTSYVNFEGHQVSVSSCLSEVHDALRQRFPTMLHRRPTNVIGRLEVGRQTGTYSLNGELETPFSDQILTNVLEQLNRAIAQRFIDTQTALLWFHAAAVCNDDGAVVLPGGWGYGKSTLSAKLADRGWTYLSDDLVPLDPRSGSLLPFPCMPAIRQTPPAAVPRERLSEVAKDIVTIPLDIVAGARVPLVTLIFPEYRFDGPIELTSCSPASAVVELLRNCLNFTVHGSAAVSYLCDILAQRRAFRLTFNDAGAACDLIASVHGEGDFRRDA